MSKLDRKILYELARPFGISGNSRGRGVDRYPVMNKSKGTKAYNEILYLRVEQRVARMNGLSGKIINSPTKQLKHGDIVGAGAPVIAESNKGRQLLEKMGWREGEALGTEANKGILEPISQVFRASRAGLS
jgi:hypothetical protein